MRVSSSRQAEHDLSVPDQRADPPMSIARGIGSTTWGRTKSPLCERRDVDGGAYRSQPSEPDPQNPMNFEVLQNIFMEEALVFPNFDPI